MPEPSAVITNFVETLWLQDGLSQNTQLAYQRDLVAFEQWLSHGKVIC
jgi:integrase/recombinase XerD